MKNNDIKRKFWQTYKLFPTITFKFLHPESRTDPSRNLKGIHQRQTDRLAELSNGIIDAAWDLTANSTIKIKKRAVDQGRRPNLQRLTETLRWVERSEEDVFDHRFWLIALNIIPFLCFSKSQRNKPAAFILVSGSPSGSKGGYLRKWIQSAWVMRTLTELCKLEQDFNFNLPESEESPDQD